MRFSYKNEMPQGDGALENALGVKQCLGEVSTCALIWMTELGRYARVPLSERCFFVILWIWMWKHYFWI